MSENAITTKTQTTTLSPQNESYDNFLDEGKFNQIWRVATAFSKTQLVPSHFQGKVEDCFVATHMAMRLQCDPVFFMQKSYVIHGKPGIEAQLAIALINTSGLFKDPLDYEIVGDDPSQEDYKVRAVAVRNDTGKECKGPWIDWKMVKAEGWFAKTGSKWKTLPGLMFLYRAGVYFGRLFCPERLMGMSTVDELRDIGEQKDTPSAKLVQAREVIPELEPAVVDTDTGEVEQEELDPTPAPPEASASTTEKDVTAESQSNTSPDLVPGLDLKKLYFCAACDVSFNEPTLGKNNKTQCPRCLTVKIESPADLATA